jgi:glyoxylase-like metal-dependent hydrolase (beta-lactamase superfamily II)
MKVEQIYTGCLAEAAYYIESAGEVAIIDPLRESKPYIERAEKDNAQIKYVFETHFHADFVSGHIDLSNKTGATIVFGRLLNLLIQHTLQRMAKSLKWVISKSRYCIPQVIPWSLLLFY